MEEAGNASQDVVNAAETGEEGDDGTPTERSTAEFRLTLQRFSYGSGSQDSLKLPLTSQPQSNRPRTRSPSAGANTATPSTPRRSPRKRALEAGSPSPSKRTKSSTQLPVPPSPGGKRGYAPPEMYAHLSGLMDYLQPGLDVVFCGINPGYKSAQIGHHFGHHSNHFYRVLHESGFTDVRLPPEEDTTLPARFNIGMTNLVDRPTSDVIFFLPHNRHTVLLLLLT
ncbi:hypothetical protein HGRIS_007152 [Hohenbuehelia grisea]|uniref:Uracil-DNA glycosylase-like domain-containing protein n=1 Tax=Hohenbuehelia grisea TaxID=104357 RepID=A0ABR3JB67_9AGAR